MRKTKVVRNNRHYNFWVEKKPISLSIPLFNFWHTRMLQKAAEKIKNIRSLKILEVGIGFGYFAKAVKKLGCKYFAVEMNEKLANNLKKQGFDVTCGVAPPFPNKPDIGVIWLSHVLEHSVTYLGAREFIEKAYLALKPGGYIIIISPDILSWKMEFWYDDWSHGFPTSLVNCTKILNDVGFTVTYRGYHNATVFQPILQYIINLIMQLIPYSFLDFLTRPFTKRSLFYSFMSLFGWRQIYLIGKK